LLLLKLEGRVFFVNADRIAEKIRSLIEETQPAIVALDLSAVPDLEYTALKMLVEGERRQREHGVKLWLVGMNPQVLKVVQRSQLGEALGRDDMHFNLEIAVTKYLGASVFPR
jgi:sulfate permease, SulP family